MRKLIGVLLSASLLSGLLADQAQAQTAPAAPPLRPDQAAFRELYKELVETNTTLSAGNCTLAAERMAARLRAAGMPADRVNVLFTSEHPKEGSLVAVYPGTSKKLRPMLLLAHIDVVEANRADWTRDPFTLIEEGGYFYGRGTFDDKGMAAVWVDTLIRFARAGYKPARTVKLALTCGEETIYAFNGAEWLVNNRRDLIDAEFALNEGGGGRTDKKGGEVTVQTVQVGEKAMQNFRIEATNPGGHSSIPIRDNAIYQLADALLRIRQHRFPVVLSDTTRVFFAKSGAARGGPMGAAMQAIAANPNDTTAETLLNTDRTFHSMLRTTCVATLLDGGHATNALPQRAGANINCRIFPGQKAEEIRDALVAAVNDKGMSVTITPPVRPVAPPPPLDPKVIGPMERVAAKHFPGIAVIPTMSTGGTDAKYTGSAGIPTYGVAGIWADPDLNGIHGLNERLEVRSLYKGRDYLFDLVKVYAGGK